MDLKSISIDELDMSARSTNALHRAGVFTAEELLTVTEDKLLTIRNLGKKSVEEIMDKIRKCAALAAGADEAAYPSDRPAGSARQETLTRDSVRNMSIYAEDLSLSVRAMNGLKTAHIETIGDMLLLTEDDLYGIDYLGRKTVSEIMACIETYRRIIDGLPETPDSDAAETIDPAEHYDAWLEEPVNRTRIVVYLKETNVGIDSLEFLSAKAYNLLRLGGYSGLHQILFMDMDALMRIPRMDGLSAAEIRKSCRYYLHQNKDALLEGAGALRAEKPKVPQSVYQTIKMPEYRDQILRYVRMNDLLLSEMGLSARPYEALSLAGFRYMSDIVFMNRTALLQIMRMGSTSVEEVSGKICAYLDRHQDRILDYLRGSEAALIDDVSIREKILNLYRNLGFKGLHFPEIMEKLGLPEEPYAQTVKKNIGSLIAAGELEYIDYLVYRVYPSVSEFLEQTGDKNDRSVRCVRLKLDGETLESIAQISMSSTICSRRSCRKAAIMISAAGECPLSASDSLTARPLCCICSSAARRFPSPILLTLFMRSTDTTKRRSSVPIFSTSGITITRECTSWTPRLCRSRTKKRCLLR